ncbi:MAG TPA: AraC family transcriptional regulator [Gemmatimonadales bacterium]|nr:AraC family transcriptional regulator [Gemmatimonadales bacterium]
MKIPSGVLGGALDQPLCAGPFAIRLARLPAGLRLPPHAHESATLNIVLDGDYRETIGPGALRSHGPATIIAKPAGAVHANQLGAGPVECLVVELPTDEASGVVIHRSAGVARFGGKLRAELLRVDEFTGLAAEALVLELLAEVQRVPEPAPGRVNPWLIRARDLLHDEPGPATLGSLAQRIGMHPVYVARAFRVRYGCSVGEYARHLRVERARRLLHHTRHPLSEIALRTGYSDQSHLTRDFRRAFGHSPGAYRRLARRVP